MLETEPRKIIMFNIILTLFQEDKYLLGSLSIIVLGFDVYASWLEKTLEK